MGEFSKTAVEARNKKTKEVMNMKGKNNKLKNTAVEKKPSAIQWHDWACDLVFWNEYF